MQLFRGQQQKLTESRISTDIGANASAEEADEALDDTVTKVNNVVHSFRLSSTSFDKKSYLGYLKSTTRTSHRPVCHPRHGTFG